MKAAVQALSLGLLVLSGATSLTAQPADEPVLLGADGQPLPFDSREEVLDFLRTAREISSRELSEGITRARKLRLRREGVEAHAVFHHVNHSEQTVKRLPNGNVVMYLRDSYLSQAAAFEMSRLLGMTVVPPTVLRVSGGQRGSAQLWIEEAMTEERRQRQDPEPPDHTLWNQRYADMRVFDNLINNIDRNLGNMLVDSRWNLWLIDHTRSFGRDRSLPQPETVTRCSRGLWTSLRQLDRSETRRRLRPLLSAAELQAVFSRRDKLVSLLERRVSELGEKAVIFDYGDYDPGVEVRYENAERPPVADSASHLSAAR